MLHILPLIYLKIKKSLLQGCRRSYQPDLMEMLDRKVAPWNYPNAERGLGAEEAFRCILHVPSVRLDSADSTWPINYLRTSYEIIIRCSMF